MITLILQENLVPNYLHLQMEKSGLISAKHVEIITKRVAIISATTTIVQLVMYLEPAKLMGHGRRQQHPSAANKVILKMLWRI